MESPAPLPVAPPPSTTPPRNFSKPGVPSPVPICEPSSADLVAAALSPAPRRPSMSHEFWPLSIFSILRRVPVSMLRWLLFVRVLQLLFAGVVVGCLARNFLVDDFDKYHKSSIALLFAAAWTIFPTSVLTFPLLRLRNVLDPRLTLAADALACVLWGCSFAALNAVQWELRGTFWATAEGPHSSAPIKDPVFISTTHTNIPPIPLSHEKRAPMPHYISAVSTRGVRVDANGFVSNADATMTWKLGLIASYFGAGEFLLFALSTLTFAYYYHTALIIDTATSAPFPHSPLSNTAFPSSAKHDEEAATDIEAARGKESLAEVTEALVGTKANPLTQPAPSTIANNDSGIFGVGEESAAPAEDKGKKPENAEAEVDRKKLFPIRGEIE